MLVERPAMQYKVRTSVMFDPQEIEQTLSSIIDDGVSIRESINFTQIFRPMEEAIKKALIRLGWTPPDITAGITSYSLLVERVAEAIYTACSGPWEFASESGKEATRDEARAAIRATMNVPALHHPNAHQAIRSIIAGVGCGTAKTGGCKAGDECGCKKDADRVIDALNRAGFFIEPIF